MQVILGVIVTLLSLKECFNTPLASIIVPVMRNGMKTLSFTSRTEKENPSSRV